MSDTPTNGNGDQYNPIPRHKRRRRNIVEETSLAIPDDQEYYVEEVVPPTDPVRLPAETVYLPLGAQRFLAAFASCGNVRQAAHAAGVSYGAHRSWLKKTPGYPDVFKKVNRMALDILRMEAWKRAVQGTQRMRISGGRVVMDPRDPTGKTPLIECVTSDQLLMFLMKHSIKQFKDKKTISHEGTVNQNVTGTVGTVRLSDVLSADEIKALRDKLRTARASAKEIPSLPAPKEPLNNTPNEIVIPPTDITEQPPQ